MFGGSSGKRRSFFHFGNASTPSSTNSKTTTSSATGSKQTIAMNTKSPNKPVSNTRASRTLENPRSTHKLTSETKPLLKSPLTNLPHGATAATDTLQKSNDVRKAQYSNDTIQLNNNTHELNNTSIRIASNKSMGKPEDITVSTSTQPSLVSFAQRNISQSSKLRRPPPPSFDISKVRHSMENNKLNDTIETQEEQNVTEERNEVANPYEESKESIITNEDSNSFVQQHRRQRSQAEEFVDDIDDYIEHYKEEVKSPKPIAIGEDQDETFESSNGFVRSPSLENFNDLRINTSLGDIQGLESPESSLIYMSPLDVPKTSANGLSDISKSSFTIANLSNNDTTHSKSSSSSSISNNSENSETFSFSNSMRDDSSNPAKTSFTKSNLSIANPSVQDEPIKIHPTNPFIRNNDAHLSTSDNSGDHPNDESLFINNQHVMRTTDDIPEIVNRTISDNASSSSEDQNFEISTKARKFRIVNEDHPTFFLTPHEDSSTLEEDEDSYNEEASIANSNPSNNYTNSFSMGNNIGGNDLTNNNISPTTATSSPTDTVRGVHSQDQNDEDIDDITPIAATGKESIGFNDHIMNVTPFISNEASTVTSNSSNFLKENPQDNMTIFSEKSTPSQPITDMSTKSSEGPIKLVSSYVEELRLKYYPTTNFLQTPPNLPRALKQKNNLIQPKNIKVKIRTNTKQVGIKHGRVKQKLLALEISNDESNTVSNDSSTTLPLKKKGVVADHTKEFKDLLNKDNIGRAHGDNSKENDNVDSNYLNDIPGDDAYNSDDIMAPLREKHSNNSHHQKHASGVDNAKSSDVSRNDTVLSYFTRSQNKLRKEGKLPDDTLPNLPKTISIDKYKNYQGNNGTDTKSRNRSASVASVNTQYLTQKISGPLGLHVANPDSDSA